MTILSEASAKARKDAPVYSGFMKYFPNAMIAVAQLSKIGNEQHNPGQPLHWAKEKSNDHMDCQARHMLDHASGVPVDGDNVLHLTKNAWRAMAQLEIALEAWALAKKLASPEVADAAGATRQPSNKIALFTRKSAVFGSMMIGEQRFKVRRVGPNNSLHGQNLRIARGDKGRGFRDGRRSGDLHWMHVNR